MCHLYEKKNSYHYVTIIEDKQNGAYIWRNVAGREWSLKPSGVVDQLTVGEECNYYKDGHKTARYTPFGVLGPGNELYTRKCKFVMLYVYFLYRLRERVEIQRLIVKLVCFYLKTSVF